MEEYVPPTSATATSSSVTLGGSEVPEAAKSHDLARSQTSSNLAADSATKKFVECARPILRLPVTRFALPLLGLLHRFYHLSHRLRSRPWAVVLSYIIKKVASRPLLLVGWLPKGIPDWLLFIPTKKVPLARIPTDKEEVILPILHFRLLLNSHHVTRPVVKQYHLRNLIGFPKLTFSGDVRHHLAINKGREAGKLRMTARNPGAGHPSKVGSRVLAPQHCSKPWHRRSSAPSSECLIHRRTMSPQRGQSRCRGRHNPQGVSLGGEPKTPSEAMKNCLECIQSLTRYW
ncbi:hypothetical protein Cgig2_012320 [Carnegiea gigantea]|uniref:Uncharacterized protein n=1 Tax=Carnegiea gigantea TaxID=171969 RepID=A0A9Q1JT82_9CARY|nr:hypothetical protein Cgig2_012320 [Carnegiea gigantea]